VFIMKKIVLVILAIISIIFVVVCSLGYHGKREFKSADNTLPSKDIVVANARSLSGTPYDPLMGMHGNIGTKAGFIVCSDIPNIAYGLSGFSLKRMIEEDYERNPYNYSTDNGNKPGNPYFHRRARNLYSYFRGNGHLFSPGTIPHVGDLVFYKTNKRRYVSHIMNHHNPCIQADVAEPHPLGN
jgi:uncharacterized protein YijF (DUF1287 family)